MYDLMIIGGGPAALTAAVYAARKKLNAVVISKDIGGQVNSTLGIENYMGYQFIEGTELIKKFEEQVKQFPLDTQIGEEVSSLSQANGTFKAITSNGESFQAKAVIIASGKRPRPLNVPGEDRLLSKGVTYCAICDGPLFADMKVAIVGGGNSALEAADDMIKIADHIYLVCVTRLTGDQVLIDKTKKATNLTTYTEHEVLEITGENFVDGIRIRDLKSKKETQLEVTGVFIEVGLIPNSDYAKDIATLNSFGEVEVNSSNETGVTGLYAAGDVTNVPEKQIVVATGEGAKAALQAHRYLQRLSE
jgi:alkyl hydroperoxide reductase subunit F